MLNDQIKKTILNEVESMTISDFSREIFAIIDFKSSRKLPFSG
jgi:hypothetical protein